MPPHPLVAAFVFALVVPTASSPAPPTTEADASFDVRTDVELRARDGASLTLDAYVPRTSGTHPAVVLVHGGSWTGGDKTDFAAIGATLTEFDWVALSVNYRLSVGMIDQQADDILATVRWVDEHADELHVDPSRIAVLGASAGGHLAALAATRGDAAGAPIAALVAWSGIFDLGALAPKGAVPGDDCNPLCQQTFGSGVLEGVVGCSYEACPSRYDDASPVNHVGPDTPPMLLAGSDGDAVPPSQARDMARAVRAAGVPAETEIIGSAAHGYELGPAVWEQTTGFLQQQLARSEGETDGGGTGRGAIAVGAAAIVVAAFAGVWFWARGRRRARGFYG